LDFPFTNLETCLTAKRFIRALYRAARLNFPHLDFLFG